MHYAACYLPPVSRCTDTPNLSSHECAVPCTGVQRPVQRIAGQAATGPEEDLPFVLDDDAVAQAYEERLQEQHAADLASGPNADAAEVQALRPRYGHRSPASALAGERMPCPATAAGCAALQAVLQLHTVLLLHAVLC